MKTLLESKERLGQTIEQSQQLADKAGEEGRDMSAEEQGLFDSLMDEHDRLLADVGRMERLQTAKANSQKSERKSVPQDPGTKETPASRISFPRHHGTIRNFKQRSGETWREVEERVYRAGKWFQATVFRNAEAQTWCVERGMDVRAHSEGVGSLGGYLVPDEIEHEIIVLRETYGTFRKYTQVTPMASDTKIVPRRTGGLTAYPIGEAAAMTESTKSWDDVALNAKKWAVLAKYSSELNEDAIVNIGDDLTGEAAYALAYAEDNCAFNGDGTSTYHGTIGILARMIDGNHAASYYTASGLHTWLLLTASSLAGIMALLPNYALVKNPKWYCPVAAKSLLFDRLANALSGNRKGDIATENITTYCGYEIVKVPAWAGTATTDFTAKIGLLFGDMQLATTLGDRRGISIKVLNELYAANDQIGLIVTDRFDINVHDVGSSSVAGPLVGLLGN